VLSEAQNCYAKDRLWKSAVREISLVVHANFVTLKLSIDTDWSNPLKPVPVLAKHANSRGMPPENFDSVKLVLLHEI